MTDTDEKRAFWNNLLAQLKPNPEILTHFKGHQVSHILS